MTILRPLITSWLNTLALALTYLVIGSSIDRIIHHQALSTWHWITLIAAPILVGIIVWAGNVGFPRAIMRHEKADRNAIVTAVFNAAPQSDSEEWTGRTVSTATDAVERSANFKVTFLGPMIGAMTSPIIATVVIMIAIDGGIGLWLLAAVPLVPVLIGGFQRAFSSVSKRYRVASRRLAARYLDAIQGLTTLRALGSGRAEGRKIAGEAENVRKNVMRMLLGNQLILLVSDAAFSLGMITVAAALAIDHAGSGAISAGQAVAVVLIATLLLEPLDRIGQFFYIGMGGIAARREIKTFVTNAAHRSDGTPDAGAAGDVANEATAVVAAGDAAGHIAGHAVANPANPANLANPPQLRPTDSSASTSADIAVDCRNVTFGYRDDQLVLRNLTWQVPVGQRVAIMGESGGGKSTLLSLIQGIYQPTSGTVAIGGVDLSRADSQWITSQIGVVAQSTYLFTGTLAHNLRIARPDASDDELWSALEQANLSEVKQWPHGLETQVGERGLAISGGQAQRIAIARALLKNAPILLLDEPTSQVDPYSEAAILDALERLMRDRTVIFVTHRASTAQAADAIYYLRDGVLQGASSSQDSRHDRKVEL